MENFQRNYTVFKHKRLTVVGLTGTMELLTTAGAHIQECFPVLEVAHQYQQQRDFLAVFCTDPPLDITFDQYSRKRSSILGYALDKEMLCETMENMAQATNFIPHFKQDHGIAQTWKEEFKIEQITYNTCESIAAKTKCPLEKIFGIVRYSNFLHQYKNMRIDQAQKQAHEKFKVSF